MNTDQTQRYDGLAVLGFYVLVALICGMRARSASKAYSVCTGIFILWTFPMMFYAGAMGDDVIGAGFLFAAPIYGALAPIFYLVVRKVRSMRAKPSSLAAQDASSGTTPVGEQNLPSAISQNANSRTT